MQTTQTAAEGQAITTADAGITTAGAQDRPGTPGNAAVDTAKHAPDVDTAFKTFGTQKEYDDEAAKIRRATEKEATENILKQLGLKSGEELKLAEFKKAYDASLSDAERQNNELAAMKEAKEKTALQLEEAQYTIAALSKLSGKNADDVTKYVRMARGLKDSETSIEQAIDSVLQLITAAAPEAPPAATAAPSTPAPSTPAVMPKGTSLLQPDPTKSVIAPKTLAEALRQKYLGG